MGAVAGAVVIIGFERKTGIVQPVLGLGIQRGGITLCTGLGCSLKRLAGVTHRLYRHRGAAREGKHPTHYENQQCLLHESTLAAARAAVKQIDGATITVLAISRKTMEKITLYHNPRCSKSRNAKKLLEERGAEFSVIEYLKTPLDVTELKALADKLGLPVREMLRTNEGIYRELQLDEAASDENLFKAIAEHPILLQRPIAVAGTRAVIGRPPENVLDLL